MTKSAANKVPFIDNIRVAVCNLPEPVTGLDDAVAKTQVIAAALGHDLPDGYFDSALELVAINFQIGEGLFAGSVETNTSPYS